MHELRPQGEVLNPLEPYLRAVRKPPAGRPWVLANMVAGLDGSTAIGGRVGALSSPHDAELFRLLRSVADWVLVGAGTVRQEGYGPVRLPEVVRQGRQAAGRPPVPPLAIISRSLELDWSSAAFGRADPASPTLVVTCEAADPARIEAAEEHAEVLVAGEDQVDLTTTLAELSGRGAATVLCEGGPTLLGELISLDALDELCLTLAPLMGGDPLPVALTPVEVGALARFDLAHALVHDSNLFLRYERDGSHG